jgi:hypothetical protein
MPPAGLQLHKARLPGMRLPVSWLDSEQIEVLDRLAQRMQKGDSLTRIEQDLSGSITVAAESSEQDRAGSSTAADLDPESMARALVVRLQAAEAAMATGLPLTTAEISWLIGARPGSAVVHRGHVLAVRHGRNQWTLEPADRIEPDRA